MATILQPVTGTYALTSSLGTIYASGVEGVVNASVSVRDGASDVTIYATQLHCYSGRAELSDVGTLIEEHYITNDKSTGEVTITIDDDSITLSVLYCSWAMPADYQAQKSLWCSAPTSVIHDDTPISITHHPGNTTAHVVKVVGIDDSGRPVVASKTLSGTTSSLSTNASSILAYALDSAQSGVQMSRAAYICITYDSMQHIYYLTEDREYVRFAYRNMHNAIEYIDIAGKVTRKTDVSRDSGVVSGKVVQYNQKVTRTYEIETAALSDDQCREIEQLASSHKVQLIDVNWVAHDVIITDQSCEADNDPSTLNTMKITYSLATDRPGLSDNELRYLRRPSGRIHTAQYTEEYR